MAESWYQPFREFFAHGKAMATAGLGKLGIETGVHAIPAIPVAEGGASFLASMFGGTIGGVVLFGGFGALSAVTNQIEYNAERGKIADYYRDEIAAKLGKKPENVLDSDIDIIASGNQKLNIAANKVIAEEISHKRTMRNIGIGASFIASLTVFALMTVLINAIAPGAHDLGLTAMAAKGAVGLLAYMSIKRPLVAMAETLFGLNNATTHDLVEGISKDREHGKAITREQIAEVFIAANKQISQYVEQQYGFAYDHLPLADKVAVAADLANILPLDKIAQNINNGISHASELAFTVQGDVSGVLPKSPSAQEECNTPQSFFGKVGHKCRNMIKAINNALHPEKAHPIAGISAINKAHNKYEAAQHHEHNNGESKAAARGNQPGFVENLAAQRAAQATLSNAAAIQ